MISEVVIQKSKKAKIGFFRLRSRPIEGEISFLQGRDVNCSESNNSRTEQGSSLG